MSFQKRLISGEFVVLAEMDTPKGVDISELITNARRIKGRVDAVIIPDMGDGMMRMSALGGGVLMHQQGVEAVIHVCCRDRNRIAMQAELLSAHVLGIENLVVVRGEDMAFGDHLDAKTVNDIDQLELLGAIQSLQKGVDMAGVELKGSPSFTVGCTIEPYADDKVLDLELELARKKVEAGAQFVVSPPVFDIDRFDSFMDKAKGLGVPVIQTVFLLKSVGIARYMATTLPAYHITDELINRIRKAQNRELECVRIAGEMVADLKGLAQGVQIVTLGWEYQLPAILDAAGL
ncbi:MAG: methylenetetrahydrofolate reductase [Desulfobacteraceae bacterium]|nr:methylenetetrahydrofolate reductase [Desulfobacteraceae bacterium]